MSSDRSFAIHLYAGKPAVSGEFDPTDETLGQMAETVFPLDAEDAVLEWAGSRFRLNYKYDISIMLDDILALLRDLRAAPSGKRAISWMSCSFPFRWEVEWTRPSLEIHTFPHDPSNTTLPRREAINQPIFDFVCEWMPILDAVRTAALQAGYEISKFPNGDILLSFGT